MAGTTRKPRRFRVWPGVAAPLGLTLLATVALWLFQAKVGADQAAVDSENVRREAMARQEAADIARHAQSLAAGFVEAKTAARKAQEKTLHLEAKGILDTCYRHLTVCLDSARKNAAARREVRPFPPGFDGIRVFLEIAPPQEEEDAALDALRASHTELAALLPAGCSLAVIEDNSRQLFSVGGGVPPEHAVTASVSRDFMFTDGDTTRQWSLRLDIVSPDASPMPDAVGTAGHIAENVRAVRLDEIAWQGWLLGRNGTVEAAFGPDAGPNGSPQELPPYIDVAGEWVDIDGKRLVWLEKSGLRPNLDWETAVAVAMPRPEPPLDIVEEFMADGRWSLTISVLFVLTLVGWVWFVRSLFASRPTAAATLAAAPVALQEEPRRRVVRDEKVSRAVPEARGIIVADIGEDGTVRVEENTETEKPVMPSGSLYRLQAIHRGREHGPGSRVLDQARSPVLKELAVRVRPKQATVVAKQRTGAKTEILPSMKSPTGWNKVQ